MDLQMTFRAGAMIGEKFEIVKKIGEGSLNDDIYLGQQKDLKRQVTIRILPRDVSNDKEMVQRFVQEIELTARLQHPNILPAYEAGTHAGRAYLVAAYEDGPHLDKYLEEKGPLSPEEALNIAIPVAEALAHAWNKEHVLHRNIMPDAILLADGTKPLLADFGMAKVTSGRSTDLTMAGFTIGHPESMSPEQVRADTDLDCRSDMYCLGLVLYHMLAGHPTFEGTAPMVLMESQLNKVPKSINKINEAVSDDLNAVIAKLLKKDREERQASWEELIGDLKACQAGRKPPSLAGEEPPAEEAPSVQEMTETVPETAPATPPKKKKGKGTSIVLVIIGVLIALFVLGGLFALIALA